MSEFKNGDHVRILKGYAKGNEGVVVGTVEKYKSGPFYLVESTQFPQTQFAPELLELIEDRKGWEAEGGLKFDADKPRMDLIDGYATEELAKVLAFGAKKYAAHNWRKGITFSRLIAAILRHTFAIARGEWLDPETGLPHAAHIQCTAMFLTWTGKHKPDMNDLWKQELTKEERLALLKGTTDGTKN